LYNSFRRAIETCSEEKILLARLSQGECPVFWQLWEQYRNKLYRCCLRWMGNSTDAEDALSRAMLKAWEKVQGFAGKIANFKAWLRRLTRNLCVDIYREQSRGAREVESIDAMGAQEAEGLVATVDTTVRAARRQELRDVIGSAIEELPERLREAFVLRFVEEKSYREIAEQLAITYDNVRKRIQQARVILQKQLNGYVSGEDGAVVGASETTHVDVPCVSVIDSPSLPPSPKATPCLPLQKGGTESDTTAKQVGVNKLHTQKSGAITSPPTPLLQEGGKTTAITSHTLKDVGAIGQGGAAQYFGDYLSSNLRFRFPNALPSAAVTHNPGVAFGSGKFGLNCNIACPNTENLHRAGLPLSRCSLQKISKNPPLQIRGSFYGQSAGFDKTVLNGMEYSNPGRRRGTTCRAPTLWDTQRQNRYITPTGGTFVSTGICFFRQMRLFRKKASNSKNSQTAL